MSAVAAVGAVGAAVGAAGVAAVENEDYQRLFVTTFPGTVFLDPRTICSCFEINHVWKLSHKKVKDHDVRVVASLQLHSLQILSPVPGGQTGVYHANLEYEVAPSNVTRITGADLVPQHAYYYLVMKIYELFLHPAASESMFHPDMEHIAQFITEQLNSGLADGRAFFEVKVTRFLQLHPRFLQTTDAQELQNNINAIWDLLRSDEYKNAGNTMQKGIVSTISRRDVEEYSLEGQGTVSAEGADAFKKTVYGFHVLVYIGGHVISMSLSRASLFSSRGIGEETVFSFFNSDMIKYMASFDFLKQVYGIIELYIKSNSNRHHELDGLQSGYSDQCDLTVVECGCKSPVFVDDSTRPLTLTTNTKLPGRREYYGGVNASGNHYIFLDNFPSRAPMNTTLYVTSSERFTNSPNFCEYDNIAAVNRVLGIEYGDSVGSLYTLRDSPPQSLCPEYDKKQADLALSIALQGASTVPVVASGAASGAAVDAPGASAVEVAKPPDGLFVKVMSGVGAACNFIRGIFFPHTPTCSAEDYANIGFREHVVFCVPTKSEDIAIKGQSRPESTRWDVVNASVSWSEARALWLGKVVGMGEVGMSAGLDGGRRPVSRKYRNVKKNISRKKGKKRMSLRHRRSRRRLRQRSRSLRLKN